MISFKIQASTLIINVFLAFLPPSCPATVNFGEDHELNYHLKKNGLSQSKENREALIALGKEVKAELGKDVLTHEDVDAAIAKNIENFKALNK